MDDDEGDNRRMRNPMDEASMSKIISTHSLDKVLKTQLDGQCRLAYAAITQHHQLVQHHSSRHDGRSLERRTRGVKQASKRVSACGESM